MSKRMVAEGTEPWGIEVAAVEVKDVDLPTEMKRAMARQAESERERRAKVIAAEGEFQAAGKLAEAAQWCEQAIAADKLDPASQYLLATVRLEQGQSDTAAEALRRTLYLDPDFVLAHVALGSVCLSQGRHREAQRHFDNALALLHAHPHGEPLPASEGLTAGRLAEIIGSLRASPPGTTIGAQRERA